MAFMKNTVKFSCYKDDKASKGFGGTGDPDLQIREGGGRGHQTLR